MNEIDLEENIKDFIKEKGKVIITEIQSEFNLTCEVVTNIIHKLCEEGTIFHENELGYLFYDYNRLNIETLNDFDKEYTLNALAFCVSKKEVSLEEIGEVTGTVRFLLSVIVFFLEDSGYVIAIKKDDETYYRAIISVEQYIKKFGRLYIDEFLDTGRD